MAWAVLVSLYRVLPLFRCTLTSGGHSPWESRLLGVVWVCLHFAALGKYIILISSLGGVIYPILFHKLQPRVGFAWATRTLAFTMLATLALPLLSMKLRGKTQSPKRGLDLSAWKEISYTLFACSALFGFLGIYIPFFYVQLYALQQGIVNSDFVFYLLPLLNTGSLFGRLVGDHGRLQAYDQIILRLIADSSLYCR